jgi:pimeloyl-ACP methyl ester carboxylesterase
MGGYHCQLYASQHPERIEKLFLIDPAGTEGLDPKKNDKYNMMHLDEAWRRYTKEEVDGLLKTATVYDKHMF